MQKLFNFIESEEQPSQSGETFVFQNPFVTEQRFEVAASSPMDVITAIQAAKKSELKWRKTSIEDRQSLLDAMALHIESRAGEWARLESELTGLPDPLLLNEAYLYGAKQLRAAKASWRSDFAKLSLAPVGTCAIFLPWVLSFRILAERIAPAFLAGNTLIIKISEKNPIIGSFIAELLREVDLPPGVCNILQGRGEDFGELLAAHPAISAVDFTGRYETGEALISTSAKLSKRLRFLTGSKNSAVIFDDANFDEVLPAVLRSCLLGQGQLAESMSRIFVSTKRYGEFLECLRKNSSLIAAYSNRLITQGDENRVLKVQSELLAEGAKLLEGLPKAGHLPSFFYDVSMCSPYQLDQINGPVILVNEYKYLHEAEKWVNTGYHGHSAQVWTKDLEKARKFAKKLEVGRVWINDWFEQTEDLSFWSLKASAHGYQGPNGLVEFYSNFTQVFEMRS